MFDAAADDQGFALALDKLEFRAVAMIAVSPMGLCGPLPLFSLPPPSKQIFRNGVKVRHSAGSSLTETAAPSGLIRTLLSPFSSGSSVRFYWFSAHVNWARWPGSVAIPIVTPLAFD